MSCWRRSRCLKKCRCLFRSAPYLLSLSRRWPTNSSFLFRASTCKVRLQHGCTQARSLGICLARHKVDVPEAELGFLLQDSGATLWGVEAQWSFVSPVQRGFDLFGRYFPVHFNDFKAIKEIYFIIFYMVDIYRRSQSESEDFSGVRSPFMARLSWIKYAEGCSSIICHSLM